MIASELAVVLNQARASSQQSLVADALWYFTYTSGPRVLYLLFE
jgi:hypothetical protein